MNRITLACLAGFMMVLLSNNVPGADRHVRADLVAADGSGVIGWVDVTQMPNGGAMIHLSAERLLPDSAYSAFYYETRDCSGPEDGVGTLRMNPQGRGQVHVRIADDLEDLGSVSMRQGGTEQGSLIACATLR